uniref:PAAR domain-containing protein n=1 Tax=Cupriavidus taiwanensis TaxID=164546 RepID=UPI000E2FE180|nr:PAAR domain-containing protein [Cupriavidus taiwanensis]
MISAHICVGDRTTHGGTVIAGDATSIIGNRAMARAGDMTVCPQCKGAFPILAGNAIITAPRGATPEQTLDDPSAVMKLVLKDNG